MTQIIPICLGKAGLESSALLWQLIGLEDSIGKNGIFSEDKQLKKETQKLNAFYHETNQNKYKLNAINLDMNNQVIDSLSVGSLRDLYEKQNMINGKIGSLKTFSKGFYGGDQIIDICMDPVRKVIEKSQSFGGFMVFNSTSGGTGSGITSKLLQKLKQQYSKNQNLCVNIYPQNDELSAESAYNTLFNAHHQEKMADVSLVFDNEALTTLCQSQLAIKSPKYRDLNQLIAYSLSGITSGFRNDQCLNLNIKEIVSNFIPYPRVKFLLSSYAPLTRTSPEDNPSCKQLTIDLFSKKNILADCCFQDGKFMGVSLNYRGHVVPKDVGPGIMAVKCNKTMSFVDWCPTGMKCGISYRKLKFFQDTIVPQTIRTLSGLFNSSCVKNIFYKVVDNCNEFYNQKISVHKYLEQGLQEMHFQQAIQNISSLCQDYQQVQLQTEEDAAMPTQQY